MKNIILIKLILISILISCQKNKTDEKIIMNPKAINNMEEEILKKQILNGYLIKENGMDGINNYKYNKEDFDIWMY